MQPKPRERILLTIIIITIVKVSSAVRGWYRGSCIIDCFFFIILQIRFIDQRTQLGYINIKRSL